MKKISYQVFQCFCLLLEIPRKLLQFENWLEDNLKADRPWPISRETEANAGILWTEGDWEAKC